MKNVGKNDFKYLSQKCDNNVLDLVKQTGFYPCEYMSDFERFKEKFLTKEKFYSSLSSRKITGKEHEHSLNPIQDGARGGGGGKKAPQPVFPL